MSAKSIERLDDRDGLLRLAMCGDATISALAGIAGLFGGFLEFGGAPALFVHGMASFFIAYGVIVIGLAALPSVRRSGAGVVIANLLYTLAAGVVLLAQVFPFTPAGVAFVSASAIYTLSFAVLQYTGWRRASS